MNKEQELLEHLEKIQLGKEKFYQKLKADFIRIIKTHLKDNGWEWTYEWIKKKRENKFKNSVLGNKMNFLYQSIYSKMWSLNRKEEKLTTKNK